MLRIQTRLHGAVVVGLIAALTPGLWAQSTQEQQTVTPPAGTDAPRSLSEVQPTTTARQAMRGDKVLPGIRTDAPPPVPAQGGLIWFTSQADFEAFNAGEGKVLKGIEDFEESILDRNAVDVFDDSLESGVPNLPDGFPFPVGMTGLPNLRVQSNLGGGNPADENPHGQFALAALSNGFFGAVSDLVTTNFGLDSIDLIFTDEKSGVGFNTITFFGGPTVEVRVYSTTNVFLGVMTTPADPTGANFIGVWSPDPIGRINIFDPGNGVEGGDNIQAWAAGPPPGELIWFDNQAEFEAFNAADGKVLKGIEDFEESILDPDNLDNFDDPLEFDVPNSPDGFPFPVGMTGLPNLIVQSNTLGDDPVDESPAGVNGLTAVSAPAFGAVSDVVVSETFVNGLDLIFTDAKSGVGFNTIDLLGPQIGVIVRVFGTDNTFLGEMASPADPSGTNFIGVWSDVPIGRINIFSAGAEGGDNIQAWEEGPPGGVDFYLNADEFQVALKKAGKVFKGIETYPWEAGPGDVIRVDDPLDINTAVPGWIQPGVLLDNITYQSNLDPFGANGPNPRGLDGLALFTTRFWGATHNSLVANHNVDSLDILSGVPEPANHTAMGLQLVSFEIGASAVIVSVYDKDDNLIGKTPPIVAPVNGGQFLGIITQGEKTIGRVNIYDTNPIRNVEGLYELAVYVLGEPCPWDLDGSGDVGVKDLLILLGNWGPCPKKGDCLADFDNSGDVGVKDLLDLLGSWGPCP